jgi:hypothetical protein
MIMSKLCSEIEMSNETEVIDAIVEPAKPVAESDLFLRLVNAIRGVPSADRCRYVQAAMVFLGTPLDTPGLSTSNALGPVVLSATDAGLSPSTLPRRVNVWMGQNALDLSILEGVFHFSPSGVDVIAHTVPGKSNRERVRCCYLLAGLQGFLSTGEPRFSDETARAICRDLGCYDQANHASYIKALGNLVAGSKSSSFELTQPGLKAAAKLIQDLQTVAK